MTRDNPNPRGRGLGGGPALPRKSQNAVPMAESQPGSSRVSSEWDPAGLAPGDVPRMLQASQALRREVPQTAPGCGQSLSVSHHRTGFSWPDTAPREM